MSFLLLDGMAVLVALMGSVVIASNGPALPQTWPEFAVGAHRRDVDAVCVCRQGTLSRAYPAYGPARGVGFDSSGDLLRAYFCLPAVFCARRPAHHCALGILAGVICRHGRRTTAGQSVNLPGGLYVGLGKRVIIYGAGDSGRQLLHALNHGSNYNVVAFVDDASSVHDTVINGRPVLCSTLLESLVVEKGSLPSATGRTFGFPRAPTRDY